MIKTTKVAVKAAAFLKQKKYRHECQEFLVEGLRAVEEAVEYGKVKIIFFVPTDDVRTNELLNKAQAKGITISETYEGYMVQIADTTTPQGIIAICAMRKYTLTTLFATKKMLLVLDRVQDPGNFGTLLRTADAAGIGGVVALNGCVDLYSPKVVRSSMGALFHIPVVDNVSEENFLKTVVDNHYDVVVTSLNDGISIYEAKIKTKSAIVVGNEANGLSHLLLETANQKVFVPMKGRAESLNVAVAAAVILFELNH